MFGPTSAAKWVLYLADVECPNSGKACPLTDDRFWPEPAVGVNFFDRPVGLLFRISRAVRTAGIRTFPNVTQIFDDHAGSPCVGRRHRGRLRMNEDSVRLGSSADSSKWASLDYAPPTAWIVRRCFATDFPKPETPVDFR